MISQDDTARPVPLIMVDPIVDPGAIPPADVPPDLLNTLEQQVQVVVAPVADPVAVTPIVVPPELLSDLLRQLHALVDALRALDLNAWPAATGGGVGKPMPVGLFPVDIVDAVAPGGSISFGTGGIDPAPPVLVLTLASQDITPSNPIASLPAAVPSGASPVAVTLTNWTEAVLTAPPITITLPTPLHLPTEAATARLRADALGSPPDLVHRVQPVSSQPDQPNTGVSLYSGPVDRVQNQYFDLTGANANVVVTTDNWFIHTGGGTDLIVANGGTNVLDAGGGSNFMLGGTGFDTFFVDARDATGDIWSTLGEFHGGDRLTIWGLSPNDFTMNWTDGEGAQGFEGLTLHATAAGRPEVSLTMAGFTKAWIENGPMQVTFGKDPVSGSAFMNLLMLPAM